MADRAERPYGLLAGLMAVGFLAPIPLFALNIEGVRWVAAGTMWWCACWFLIFLRRARRRT